MADLSDKYERKIVFDLVTHFETSKIIGRHSLPILTGRSLETLDYSGTGVYVKGPTFSFVLTALHVVKDVPLPEILVLREAGRAASIPIKQMHAVNNETIDFAILELTEELQNVTPLSIDKLRPLVNPANFIYIAGYPASKVKRTNLNTMNFEQRFITTKILPDGGRYFKEFDARANFVCDFRKENLMHTDGKVATFPNPHGMSGGGVFEAIYNKRNELVDYGLIGIVTDWNPNLKRYFRCTKSEAIAFVLEYGKRPNNSPSMPNP